MDVIAVLADCLGTNNPHLPLTDGMLVGEAIDIINNVYLPMLPMSKDGFKETQAFVGTDGKITLELIDKETGNVLMSFSNYMGVPKAGVDIPNPFAAREYTSFLFEPLTVDRKEELDFLDALPVGIPNPTFFAINDTNHQLATLLNNYNYQGRWMSGTFGALSTAGFEVVYKGWSMDVPDEFLLDYSPYVVILKLREGEQRGFVCLRT